MTAPFGYQSGYTTSPIHNDDTYPSTFLYDAQHNLIYFTGVTYSTFFDKVNNNNLSPNTLGAMGMSMVDPSDEDEYHLTSGDCFLSILKLPQPSSSNNNNNNDNNEPRLIYAKRMGTPQNSEACSSMTMLPHNTVNDALLHTSNQLKLVLLGHVNPVPLSLDELEMLREKLGGSGGSGGGGLAEFNENGYLRRLERQQQQQKQQHRTLEKQEVNQGGYFTSLSHDNIPNSSGGSGGSMLGGPLTHNGRAYGFTIDFDLSLTPNEEFDLNPPQQQHNTPSSSSSSSEGPPLPLDMNNAYGALLGGHVLESSPLVYPIDITYNIRNPNQLYVVSMHSDKEDSVVYNDEYPYSVEEEMNGRLFDRPDVTLGGAGGSRGRSSSSGGDDDGSGGLFVGGVPKYGSNFYVKIQQVTITPYEQLLNVQPTPTEHVKQTMKSGWGFGFKLNDASDVRPSCIEFVKGRTPDEDLILLGGTTRKISSLGGGGGGVVEEYDGFVTKLVPPSPSPVIDETSGATVEDAIHGEGTHPTKRIDSTTGRDETVAAICLPPPDAGGMGVTHAFIVGSSTNPNGTSSQAYLLKMKLDDMSTVWKMHVPSVSSNGGVGGDVLGQGCAVSHDGKIVYLSGTIDGESGMRTGDPNSDVKPIGGMSDVFVVAYDAEFGNVKWEQQVGTKYEDKLARGGGIQVDNDGNAMIMGSTRGALQRSREDIGRMSSDVFFMSLARENGAHINAPFAGSGSNHSSSVAAAGSDIPNSGVLTVTSVVVTVVAMISALLIIVVRRRRRGKAAQKEVSRMWDRRDSDDHSYTNRYTDRPSSKDEIDESGDEDRTSSGALRIVRGGVDDGWDDGTEIINRGVWKRVGSIGSEKSSGSSKVTNSQTYVRKDSEDSASFLAKLREESSERMKGLSGMMNISDATDPRMDDGASIKNLLSQYREVKKGGIISSDGKAGKSSSGKKTPPKSRPPPPPPPRRNYDGEPDGLSEFTIV